MPLRRRSSRDASSGPYTIMLLDKYGRSIERHEVTGTSASVKRKAARMLAGEYLRDHLVFGVSVRRGHRV